MAQSMQPATAILARLYRNSERDHDEVFTRLMRYMFRPDIYRIADAELRAVHDRRALTGDGAGGLTADYVCGLISGLRTGAYRPECRNAHGYADALVQTALRMILDAIYEPVIRECPNGHVGRTRRDALAEAGRRFCDARWFIRCDLSMFIAGIDHELLLDIISRKVKDARFRQLIRGFLKGGCMEEGAYHETRYGLRSGGMLAPVLEGICLHELDQFVSGLRARFEAQTWAKPECHGVNAEVARCRHKADDIGEAREDLTDMKVHIAKRTLEYVRYAAEMVMGVQGSKADCMALKRELERFLRERLGFAVDERAVSMARSGQGVRFLGYDMRVRRGAGMKKAGRERMPAHMSRGRVELNIPLRSEVERFLLKNGIARKRAGGKLEPCRRTGLIKRADLEILSVYNAELRDICAYYGAADNFGKLSYLGYLMEYSCLKTLAARHRSSISQIKAVYKDGKGGWGIPYRTKAGARRMYISRCGDWRRIARDCAASNEKRYR